MRSLKQYQDQSGKEVADDIVAATIMAGVKDETVPKHLSLNASTLDTSKKVIDSIRSYLRAERTWTTDDTNQTVPMEVDALG